MLRVSSLSLWIKTQTLSDIAYISHCNECLLLCKTTTFSKSTTNIYIQYLYILYLFSMTKAPELSGCRPFIGFGHPFFIPNHPHLIFISSLHHLLSSFRSSSTHRYSSSHHPQVIFTIILYSSLLSSFRHPTVHLYIILHHPHLISLIIVTSSFGHLSYIVNNIKQIKL